MTKFLGLISNKVVDVETLPDGIGFELEISQNSSSLARN